ncbi:hypothetical protein WN50_10945 [Limnoraphis robusta CS-951]|uniref:Uncharacterized protein n=1 Tax=Limnoraphis robusta CS-951 TaxID=1637645 RepID=A0A0F5YIQ4_9CYAN|nr:hypothetical protein WN50_10945 [Limnoraphis robusta CS-951]
MYLPLVCTFSILSNKHRSVGGNTAKGREPYPIWVFDFSEKVWQITLSKDRKIKRVKLRLINACYGGGAG